MWKVVPSLASKLVELHINPLTNYAGIWTRTHKPLLIKVNELTPRQQLEQALGQISEDKHSVHTSLAHRSQKTILEVTSISNLKAAQNWIFCLCGVFCLETYTWMHVQDGTTWSLLSCEFSSVTRLAEAALSLSLPYKTILCLRDIQVLRVLPPQDSPGSQRKTQGPTLITYTSNHCSSC